MSKQQYRTIADRDKGDDIRKRFMRGDRVTFGTDEDGRTIPVRIERPVPNTDEPHSRACGARKHPHGPECSENCPTCHGATVAKSSVPTREQIAEARDRIAKALWQLDMDLPWTPNPQWQAQYFERADTVLAELAPIWNGANR